MLEVGMEPPSRQDFALRDLRDARFLSVYLMEMDRWFKKLVSVVPKTQTFTVTIDPALIAANTIVEQTFTVTGLTTSDIVVVNKPSDTAGLGIVGARASAANTLAIRFYNATGVGIDPPSENYLVVAIRR